MILESEDIIIKKAISGDDGAFETLVRTYESFVYNVAYQSLKSQDDAFDVSQKVFIKVYLPDKLPLSISTACGLKYFVLSIYFL